MNGLAWADYVAGHPERLPRGGDGETWAGLAPGEYRRVTRNWQRWRKRRLDNMAKPLVFRHVIKPDGAEWVIRDNGVVGE